MIKKLPIRRKKPILKHKRHNCICEDHSHKYERETLRLLLFVANQVEKLMADVSKLTVEVDRVVSLDTQIITILRNIGSGTDQAQIDAEIAKLVATNDLTQAALDAFNNPPVLASKRR